MALQQAATFSFDKVVAFTPFLAPSARFEADVRISLVRRASKIFPRILGATTGWGARCDIEREIFHRPGPCTFQMRHYEAIRALGHSTQTIYARGLRKVAAAKYLIVGVAEDAAVDTSVVRQFAATLGVRYWELPPGVSHSVLSIYASAEKKPWWNCEVVLRMLDFLSGREISGPLESTPEQPRTDSRCFWPYTYPAHHFKDE